MECLSIQQALCYFLFHATIYAMLLVLLSLFIGHKIIGLKKVSPLLSKQTQTKKWYHAHKGRAQSQNTEPFPCLSRSQPYNAPNKIQSDSTSSGHHMPFEQCR